MSKGFCRFHLGLGGGWDCGEGANCMADGGLWISCVLFVCKSE